MGDPYYPWYPGDYLKDTPDLSMLEDGAYRRLLDNYFVSEGNLPVERSRLYRICRAFTVEEQSAVNFIVERFFKEENGQIYNKRADKELSKRKKFIESQQVKSKLGVEARWGKQEINILPGGMPTGMPVGLPLPSSSSSSSLSSTSSPKKKTKEKKNIYLDFVSLTDQEHKKLIDKFGEPGTQTRIEKLNNYIGSKGIKYKSHYHTILNWEAKNGSQGSASDIRKGQAGEKDNIRSPGKYDNLGETWDMDRESAEADTASDTKGD